MYRPRIQTFWLLALGVLTASLCARSAQAQSLTTLHSFSGYPSDGDSPYAGLVQASDGNLYGTTNTGGANGWGTVFKMTPSGTLTILYSFTGGSDEGVPGTALIQAKDGNLYGTTAGGGASGNGTVFKITTSGTLTTLHVFSGSDGAGPNGLIQAKDGNLYGTTYGGGANGDNGTVFQLTPLGMLTTLYSFSGSDGYQPFAALIQAKDGNLYGTTEFGGPNFTFPSNLGYGTVFRFNMNSVPVISSLKPAKVNAGGPAFTLTVNGANFANNSTVYWTAGNSATPLTTTFVSATQLTASVPASLYATPVAVNITVVTPGAGASNAKSLILLVTTLKLLSTTLTRNSDGSCTATISIKNVGYLTAPNFSLTSSTLGGVSTSTSMPVNLGDVAAGATIHSSLSYPSSAGSPGSKVSLKVFGQFTGGYFSGSLTVTLP